MKFFVVFMVTKLYVAIGAIRLPHVAIREENLI